MTSKRTSKRTTTAELVKTGKRTVADVEARAASRPRKHRIAVLAASSQAHKPQEQS